MGVKSLIPSPPARPAGRVSWTFPTPRGQPAVSSGLGLRTGSAWIGLKTVREKKGKKKTTQARRGSKEGRKEGIKEGRKEGERACKSGGASGLSGMRAEHLRLKTIPEFGGRSWAPKCAAGGPMTRSWALLAQLEGLPPLPSHRMSIRFLLWLCRGFWASSSSWWRQPGPAPPPTPPRPLREHVVPPLGQSGSAVDLGHPVPLGGDSPALLSHLVQASAPPR